MQTRSRLSSSYFLSSINWMEIFEILLTFCNVMCNVLYVSRGQSYKSMHICLATDVNTTFVKDNAPQRVLKEKDMMEHVLCTIKLYQNGLLEVTPGISGPVSETEGVFVESKGLASNRLSMSAFLDDKTVEKALLTGFQLSTSSVRSRTGVEYDYCIQNSNDLLVPFQLEEILKRQNILDMRSCAMNKCSTENTNWTQDSPAPGRQKVYTVYAEIITGENFIGKKIFLNYQVQVPQGWDLRTGNMNDGVSEKRISALNVHKIGSSGNGSGGGQGRTGDGMGILGPGLSGADILALDSYSDGIDAHGMLRGTTHTATSKDFRPQRGKGKSGVSFVLEESARIFLGSSFFIITVISVILGLSYPFWLVPAFVILFTLRTGVPMSTVVVVSVQDQDNKRKKHLNLNLKSNTNKNKISLIERNQKQEILKMKHSSITYSTNEPFKSIGTPLSGTSIANFNHLINMSFDVKDVEPTPTTTHTHTHIHTPTPRLFQDTPTIHFQVYSVTAMERHVLEGYGSFKMQGLILNTILSYVIKLLIFCMSFFLFFI